MILTRFLLILICLFGPLGALAAAPTVFPEQREVGGQTLDRLGTGSFRWMFFRVYDGALYLGGNPAERSRALDTAIPRQLELSYHVGIPAQKIVKGGDAILRRNIGDVAFERLRPRLERLNAAYRDVQSGDRYTLTYIPGQGTELKLNGASLVTIEGEDFAAAYFQIWLGPDPIAVSFREALLGG